MKNNIQCIRESIGYTQKDISEIIQKISRSEISKIETTIPEKLSYRNILLFARLYHCPQDDITGDDINLQNIAASYFAVNTRDLLPASARKDYCKIILKDINNYQRTMINLGTIGAITNQRFSFLSSDENNYKDSIYVFVHNLLD